MLEAGSVVLHWAVSGLLCYISLNLVVHFYWNVSGPTSIACCIGSLVNASGTFVVPENITISVVLKDAYKNNVKGTCYSHILNPYSIWKHKAKSCNFLFYLLWVRTPLLAASSEREKMALEAPLNLNAPLQTYWKFDRRRKSMKERIK